MQYSEKLELLCEKLNISQKELERLLSENYTVVNQIEEKWRDGASAQEIADILGKNGIKVETTKVEELLTLLQEKQAKTITDVKDVDLEQLRQVNGGGMGIHCSSTDDCDNHFKDSFYQGVMRCVLSNFCDEITTERCHEHSGTLFGLAK